MDLEQAKQLLFSQGYTCVLCRGEQCLTSRFRGIRPLVSWHAGQTDVAGYSAADKVVGKATAFLYVLLQVRAVYAGVISRSAREVLIRNGIAVEYGTMVDNIINRTGDGICPFEEAVLEIQDPRDAYPSIRRKMEQLHIEL